MTRLLLNGFLFFVSLLQAGCSLFGIQKEEGPKYRVVQSNDNKEIREYASYVAATTWVEGNFKGSQNTAFRVLAGYIFGDNTAQQKIAMTSPVVQSPQATEQKSQKIAMTAPVIQSPSKNGWEMSFMMPSQYKLEDLPKPNDSRVVLRVVPEKTIGVIKFTGLWSEEKNATQAQELKSWLSSLSQYEIISEPMFAGYNPPWTIPFFRRNEMMVQLKPVSKK